MNIITSSKKRKELESELGKEQTMPKPNKKKIVVYRMSTEEKISNLRFRVAELKWELKETEKNLENLKRGIE